MRWTNTTRTNIRSVLDNKQIYNRILNTNRVLLNGFGSPCTLYKNSTISPHGTEVKGLTRCYCWNSQNNSPDRSHILCDGTGYLEGYQKYGYTEYTLSTPSTYSSISSNIAIQADRRAFVLSGSGTVGTIETTWLSLLNFKDVDYFLVADQTVPSDNRVRYYYTVDDINWVELVMSDTSDLLSNKKASNFVLQEPFPSRIKFRIVLEKRTTTSPSPKFNSIRFRFRNHLTLKEIDKRFDIHIPAFLASRQPPEDQITQGEYGWTVVKPVKWWVLPEVNVEESDVIEFLTGEFAKLRFRATKVVKYTHGPQLQILHREFESVLIRATEDVGGVLYSLL